MIFFLIATLLDNYERTVLENYSPSTLRYFTVLCRKYGEGDRLLRVTKELNRKYPESTEIKIAMAQAYFIKGNKKKGLRILKEFIIETGYIRREVINILMDFGYYKDAEKFIKILRKKFKNNNILSEKMAWIYEKEKDYDEAVREWIKVYNRTGRAYYIKRVEKLLPYIKKGTVLEDIKDISLRERLKLLYFIEKGEDELNVKDKRMVKEVAEMLFDNGEYEKAEKLFNSISDSTGLARIYIAKEDYRKARLYVNGGYYLAYIYAMLGYSDSLRILMKQIELNCSDKIKFLFYGGLYDEVLKEECSESDTLLYIKLLVYFIKDDMDKFITTYFIFMERYRNSSLIDRAYLLYLSTLEDSIPPVLKKLVVYDFKHDYENILKESHNLKIDNMITFLWVIEAYIKRESFREALQLISQLKGKVKDTSFKQLLLLEEIKLRYSLYKDDPVIKRLYDEIMIINPRSPYAHAAREFVE